VIKQEVINFIKSLKTKTNGMAINNIIKEIKSDQKFNKKMIADAIEREQTK